MTRMVDPFEELAAMFLTSPDEPSGGGGERATKIELLAVGHLPVRAGLWITPYADMASRQLGPVGLVRLDGQTARLQVLNGSATSGRVAGDTLQTAIESLTDAVRYWMICTPPETAPAEMLRVPVDRISLLSSTDDAAVVRAYEFIRDLGTVAADAQASLPAMGVAVVGSSSERATAMVEKLDATARRFLGLQVQLVGHLPRMDADLKVTDDLALTDQPVPPHTEVIGWIRRLLTTAQPREVESKAEPQSIDAEPMESSDTPSFSTVRPPRDPQGPRPAGTPASPPPVEAVPSSDYVAEIGGPSPRVEGIRLQPKAVETKPAGGTPHEPCENGRPLPLARFVDGLSSIAPRCPGRERVELAVDVAGRLHLLGREDTLRQLHSVSSWARDHRELLAMACPDHAIDPLGDVICHVFTDEPAGLSDLHGSELRLHVLAPVEVEGRTGWYSAPLS